MSTQKPAVQVGILVDGVNIGVEIGSLLSEPHAIDRKKVAEALEKLLPGKVGNYYESLAKSIATRMQAAYQIDQAIEIGLEKGTYHVYAPVNYPGCIAGKETQSKNFSIGEGIKYLPFRL